MSHQLFKNARLFDCPECGYEYRGKDANIYNHWLLGFRRGECPGCRQRFEYEVTAAQVRTDRIGRAGTWSSMAVLVGIVPFVDHEPWLGLLLIPTVIPWLYAVYQVLRAGAPNLRLVQANDADTR